MRKLLTKRNILTVCFSLMMFISAAFAILFAQSKVTAFAAEGNTIEGMSLSLQSDLVVKIDVADSVSEVTAYVKGTEGEELNKATLTEKNAAGQFEYHGVTPQLMGNAVVITADDGSTVEKSVKEYCETLLAAKKSDFGYTSDQMSKLKTLAVDILNYGAAAQEYKAYNTSALANAGLTEEQKALASTYTEAPQSVKASKGAMGANGEYIRGAGVRFDNNAGLYFTVVAPNGTDGMSVEVAIGDQKETLTTFFSTEEENVYTVLYEGVYVAQYDNAVTAQIYANGEAVGNKVTYSVNSYVAEKDDDAVVGSLVKNLYLFNQSAVAFRAADSTESFNITDYALTSENGDMYLVLSGTQTGYIPADITTDYETSQKYQWLESSVIFNDVDDTFEIKFNLTKEAEENTLAFVGTTSSKLNVFPHVYINGAGWSSSLGGDIPMKEDLSQNDETYTYEMGNLAGWNNGRAFLRVSKENLDYTFEEKKTYLEVGENNEPYLVIESTYSGMGALAAENYAISKVVDLQAINVWEPETPEFFAEATDGTCKLYIYLGASTSMNSDYFLHYGTGNYYGTIEEGATTDIVALAQDGYAYRYTLRNFGSNDYSDESNKWKNDLTTFKISSIVTPTNSYLEVSGDKVLFVLGGTYDTSIGEELFEKAKAVLDLQGNPTVSKENWDGNDWSGDWGYHYPEMVSFAAKNGTFEIKYNITDLDSYDYQAHFNVGDLKLDIEQSQVSYGERVYTMLCYFGSGAANEYYGCVGINIKEA